jgi:hypothetical protein
MEVKFREIYNQESFHQLEILARFHLTLPSTKRNNIFMTPNSQITVTVNVGRLEKWLCAKILTARGSGSIWIVLRRKTYRKNGIAWNAKNKRKKQEMCIQGASLSIEKVELKK